MADAHLDLQDSVSRNVLKGTEVEAAAVHGARLDSRLCVITGNHAFLSLEKQWLQLEESCTAPRSVFQSFSWLKSWIEVYGNLLEPDAIRIIAGYRGARLVFAWPLLKDKAGPVSVLRWLSEPMSQYGDVLVADGECSKAWMTDALALLKTLSGVDVIRLRHVRADAAAAPFLEAAFHRANLEEKAPWLDLSCYADEAAYEARYTAAQRKRRKKIRKALEADFGPLELNILRPGPAVENSINAAIAEKCQWIESRGRQNRVLCCSRIGSFLKEFSRNG